MGERWLFFGFFVFFFCFCFCLFFFFVLGGGGGWVCPNTQPIFVVPLDVYIYNSMNMLNAYQIHAIMCLLIDT